MQTYQSKYEIYEIISHWKTEAYIFSPSTIAHFHISGLTWRAWLARLAWGARDICIRGKNFFTSDLLAKISSIIWQQSNLPRQYKQTNNYVRYSFIIQPDKSPYLSFYVNKQLFKYFREK